MRTTSTEPIIRKLGGVRTRIRLLLLGNSLFMFLLVAGGLIAGSFFLDWLFQLPLGARTIMLVIMVGVMLRGAWRFFLGPFKVGLSDDGIALLVEERHPEFGDELISALQLAQQMENGSNTESRDLMASAVSGALARFEKVSFDDTITPRPLVRPAFMSFAAVLVVFLYGTFQPDHVSIWFDRCVLLEDRAWPPKTVLDVRIANLDSFRHEIAADGSYEIYVPESAVIRVEVTADGEIPPTIRLKKFASPRDENPDPISIELAGRPDSAEFEYKFGRVTSSFEFYVQGGDDDDELPYFRVFVRAAPRIDDLAVDYDFPGYVNDTGIEDKTGIREYNVVGPVGTRVDMHFRASAEVASFQVIVDDLKDDSIELKPNPDDPLRFTWSMVLTDDHFYTYRLVGANGAPSREAPNFNISAQPDLAPQIGVLMPETASVDVSPEATIPLAMQVVDDYRVGDIEYRWDAARDGAYGNRVALGVDDLRVLDDEREVDAFVALEVRSFTAVQDGKTRALRPGDNVFVRLVARDTRVTTAEPEPNVTVHSTPIALHVREAVEIERELMRGQVRLKDQIKRVEESVRARLAELTTLVSTWGGEGEEAPSRDDLHAAAAGQALITSSLGEAARGFVRVFDGYLFNRMDPSNLTEAMIAELCGMHRKGEGSHYEHISKLMPRVRAQLDDSEIMGKLTKIMDILMTTSDVSSPAVGAAIKICLAEEDRPKVVEGLRLALEREEKLHQDVLVLVEKMEEWEDFQDVIQSLKDIIELEKGLWNRMKKEAK